MLRQYETVLLRVPSLNIFKSKGMELELKSNVLEMLKRIGIGVGHIVLDFGCGYGAYTILIAEIVGEQGRVYALDKDKEALDSLMHRGELEGLKNIDRMDTSGGLGIGLADESVDVVLLFNVFHSSYFPKAVDRKRLLSEISRVMKPFAFLSISVWPNLVEPEVEDEIKDTGFHLEKKIYGMPGDNNGLETCSFLNFGKA